MALQNPFSVYRGAEEMLMEYGDHHDARCKLEV